MPNSTDFNPLPDSYFEPVRDALNQYLPPETSAEWPLAFAELKRGIHALLDHSKENINPDALTIHIDKYTGYSTIKGWSSGTLRQLLYKVKTIAQVRQRMIDLTVMIIAAFPGKKFWVTATTQNGLQWFCEDKQVHESTPVQLINTTTPNGVAHDEDALLTNRAGNGTAAGKHDLEKKTTPSVQFAGFNKRYQGYSVKHETDEVLLFECSLDEQGAVAITFNEGTHTDDKLDGQAQRINQTVRFNLAYVPEARTHRIHYYLEKAFTNKPECPGGPYWCGTYAGFHANKVKPIAGRVLLQVPESPGAVVWADMKLTDFSRNWAHAGVILNLLGEPPRPAIFEDGDNTLFPFEGIYTCFVVSRGHSRSRLLPYRLTISPDATVLLQRKGVYCSGSATVIKGNYLSVQFEEIGSFVGSMLLSLNLTDSAVEQYREVRHLFGLLTKAQEGIRLESSAMVMVREHAWNADKEWDAEIDRNSPDFNALDLQYQGLFSFLNGQIYRQIRLSLPANSPFRPRSTDYRRVAFYAACHLAGQLNEAEKETNRDEYDKKVNLLRAHIHESFQIGFAAQKFGGVKIPAAKIDRKRLLKLFAKHRLREEYDILHLKNELGLLQQDDKLLRDAANQPNLLGHPDIIDLVHSLWPRIKTRQNRLKNQHPITEQLARIRKIENVVSPEKTKPETT